MKLCLSNIAWDVSRDEDMYRFMYDVGFCGLEIAPTRIFGNTPYENLVSARDYARRLKNEYHLDIVSMQSIWYGRKEMIFNSREECDALLCYTRSAIEFASGIGCRNIAFGSPKNRVISNHDDMSLAFDFFGMIADFAQEHGVVFALEPNPTIYGTNFLNTTAQALEFCRQLNKTHLKINLDFGTILHNREELNFTKEDVNLINHVHISEPNLKPIIRRPEHLKLNKILEQFDYRNYVSVEMGINENVNEILQAAHYLKEVFS